MDSFDLDVKDDEFQEYASDLRDEVIRAVPNAINRALTLTKSFATDLIQQTVNIKSKDLSKSFIIFRASKSRPEAQFIFAPASVPFSAFKPKAVAVNTARGTRQGVTVDIEGSRSLVEGGFLATMPSGKTGVFKRSSSARSNTDPKKRNRLPIREVRTNIIGKFFSEDSALFNRVEEFAREAVQKNIEDDLNAFIQANENSLNKGAAQSE